MFLLFYFFSKSASPKPASVYACSLSFSVCTAYAAHTSDWTWLSPAAAAARGAEGAPCARKGQWATTHFMANHTIGPWMGEARLTKSAPQLWAQSAQLICLLHCKAIRYTCPWFLVTSITEHDFTMVTNTWPVHIHSSQMETKTRRINMTNHHIQL